MNEFQIAIDMSPEDRKLIADTAVIFRALYGDPLEEPEEPVIEKKKPVKKGRLRG